MIPGETFAPRPPYSTTSDPTVAIAESVRAGGPPTARLLQLLPSHSQVSPFTLPLRPPPKRTTLGPRAAIGASSRVVGLLAGARRVQLEPSYSQVCVGPV